MINDSQIKAAFRRVKTGEIKRIELREGGDRGAGRLALFVRYSGRRVVAEWYAIYHRNKRRITSKIGSFPTVTVSEARKTFREEYVPAISTGKEPSSAASRRRAQAKAGTVKELFQAYVDHLKGAGKRSARPAECILLTGRDNAAEALGADRAACSIEPNEIVDYLADIAAKGVLVMANATRCYINAAYNFAIAAAHDYTHRHAGVDWGIKANPAALIPIDKRAYRPGTRFLSPTEVRALWDWLSKRDGRSALAPALRLIMATGQRVEEILRVSESVYERPRAMLAWEKTKNGLPHCVPLPHQAVAILDTLIPNKHGLFFPHQRDPAKPKVSQGMKELFARFMEDHPGFPKFTAKDMRRTWKTLSGDCGLSKEVRDMLQNHGKKADISSRHYDKYSYLREKREAMAKWAAYLALVLDGTIKEIGQRDSNVVPIGRGEAA